MTTTKKAEIYEPFNFLTVGRKGPILFLPREIKTEGLDN